MGTITICVCFSSRKLYGEMGEQNHVLYSLCLWVGCLTWTTTIFPCLVIRHFPNPSETSLINVALAFEHNWSIIEYTSLIPYHVKQFSSTSSTICNKQLKRHWNYFFSFLPKMMTAHYCKLIIADLKSLNNEQFNTTYMPFYKYTLKDSLSDMT
jgi:hypothetical protein